MTAPIPIIDIFAGPGGLGEGFSSVNNDIGDPVFKIRLSIEKDRFAHSTLLLRSFYRQFTNNEIPLGYYQYLRAEINREELFSKFPVEAAKAMNEAWLEELGHENNQLIDNRICQELNGTRNWVLIGGPPCQAYSLVGRSRMRGENEEKYQKDPRHFLYKEYLRILAIHQPSIFVMENVKGLLSAKVKDDSTFDLILTDLQKPLNAKNSSTGQPLQYHLFSLTKRDRSSRNGFVPRDFIIQSEKYGIPQARHRIIILGIRSDFYKSDPDVLFAENQVLIHEVLDDLPKLRSGLSKETDSPKQWHEAIYNIKNSKWINIVDQGLRNEILHELDNMDFNLSRGNPFIPSNNVPLKLSEWLFDKNIGGVCNHETRGHIRQDLHRYFYASVFARQKEKSPTMRDFPTDLLPSHKNILEAVEGEKFSDRFRVQVRNRPATTIVSHISKDGHYYIHYDPSQCRSLTVREAARIQTFPDNYFFEGNKTQQYHQIGNAVPPLLARKIAMIVANVLEKSELDK